MFVSWLLTHLKREEGQGLTEYALILGAIAVLVVAAFVILGNEITALIQAVGNQLAGVPPNP